MGFSAAGSILLLRFVAGIPLVARLTAIAAPLVCGFFFVRSLARNLKRLDELQLRIHLEAAATASVGLFIAAVVYPVAQMAGFVGALEPYEVVLALAVLVLFGYISAIRRYR
jgi:hypothetical protein